MKVNIINSELLHNIKTIVLYSFKKFIPTDKSKLIRENHLAEKVLYLGNENQLSSRDDIEYGFDFQIDKQKYNDNSKISFLTNESKDLIGLNTEDIVIIEKSAFPTNTKIDEVENYSYFGTCTINNSKVIVLDLQEKIYKIEFYEDIILSNNTSGKFIDYETGMSELAQPSFIITLGPEKNIESLADDNYYENDKPSETITIPILELRKLKEEVDCKKYLIISFPESKKDNIKVNLAYDSWLRDDKNPLRNLNKFLLRNDEFFSSLNNINPIKQVSTYLLDSNTGTILSNTKITNQCPILNRKISKQQSGDSEVNWESTVKYDLGALVYFNNKLYESLEKNNIGNVPSLSSKWEEENKLSDFFTSRLSIDGEPGYLCRIKPSETMILRPDIDFVEFNIIDGPGYEFNSSKISMYPPIAGESILLENRDYKHFKTQDKGHIILFEKDKIDSILRNISNLYLSYTKPIFRLRLSVLDSMFGYVSWDSWISQVHEDITISINGFEVVDSAAIEENRLSVCAGDILSIMLNNNKYQIDNKESIVISPTAEDELLGEIHYVIRVTCKTKEVIVEGDNITDFIIENPKYIVGYGDPGEVRFYLEKEGETENNYEVRINNNLVGTLGNIGKLPSNITHTRNSEGIHTFHCTEITEDLIINLKKKS